MELMSANCTKQSSERILKIGQYLAKL